MIEAGELLHALFSNPLVRRWASNASPECSLRSASRRLASSVAQSCLQVDVTGLCHDF